jgi:hypothetical protein
VLTIKGGFDRCGEENRSAASVCGFSIDHQGVKLTKRTAPFVVSSLGHVPQAAVIAPTEHARGEACVVSLTRINLTIEPPARHVPLAAASRSIPWILFFFSISPTPCAGSLSLFTRQTKHINNAVN